MTPTELISLASATAITHGLNPALVCAVCEQESSWRPDVTRYEPAFERHYIAPLGLPDDVAVQRATSYGLMQTMLQSVVEIGYTGDGPSLLDPFKNLEWGCRLLKNKLAKANWNFHTGLQFWNGGGNPNYADEVLARMSKYAVSDPPQQIQPNI